MHDFGQFWTPSRVIGRRRSFQNSAISVQESRSRTISDQILAIFDVRVHWQTQEFAEAFRSRKLCVFALADAGVVKTVISCDFCKGYIEKKWSKHRKCMLLDSFGPRPGPLVDAEVSKTMRFWSKNRGPARFWVQFSVFLSSVSIGRRRSVQKRSGAGISVFSHWQTQELPKP